MMLDNVDTKGVAVCVAILDFVASEGVPIVLDNLHNYTRRH